MHLFDYDGPLSKYGGLAFDLIILNIMVVVISMFTFGIGFGASMTALIFTIDRSLVEGRGRLIETFYRSFKLNFIKATFVWTVSLIIIAASMIAYKILLTLGIYLELLNVFIILEILFFLINFFSILAFIDVRLKVMVHAALVMGHKHWLRTGLCLLTTLVSILLALLVRNIFLLFMISLPGMLMVQLIVRKSLVLYLSDQQKNTLF